MISSSGALASASSRRMARSAARCARCVMELIRRVDISASSCRSVNISCAYCASCPSCWTTPTIAAMLHASRMLSAPALRTILSGASETGSSIWRPPGIIVSGPGRSWSSKEGATTKLGSHALVKLKVLFMADRPNPCHASAI
eukprot:1567301-Prymnesium_polylepis.1